MQKICAYYMDTAYSALAPNCELSDEYLLPSIPNFRNWITQNNTFKSSVYDNLQHQMELGLHQIKLNSITEQTGISSNFYYALHPVLNIQSRFLYCHIACDILAVI